MLKLSIKLMFRNICMIKASTITEIAQQFDPSKVLTLEDKDFHEDIYRSTIDPLKTKLIVNQIPTKTFYLCGQIGMGKSTALNYLPDDNINNKYDVKYLTGKDIFNVEDLDIIDILIMIGFELIKNTTLENKYYEGLNKLKDVNLENIKISKEETWDFQQDDEKKQSSGAKINVHIANFNDTIFKNLKRNQNQRQTIREIFSIDKANLIEFINDIINDYKTDVMDGEKELLLIIDDLEKINDKSIIKDVFIDNNWVFNEINCVKIIPIHIFFPRMYAIPRNDLIELDFRIETNKLDVIDDDEKVAINKQILKSLIKARLENEELISSESYDEVILKSGGNIRQLIEIIFQASISNLVKTQNVGSVIDLEDITWGVNEISNRLAKVADSKIRVLKQVLNNYAQFDEPSQKDEDDFDSLLLDNLIFFHKNGTHWYDINPIITKTVEIHGRQKDN